MRHMTQTSRIKKSLFILLIMSTFRVHCRSCPHVRGRSAHTQPRSLCCVRGIGTYGWMAFLSSKITQETMGVYPIFSCLFVKARERQTIGLKLGTSTVPLGFIDATPTRTHERALTSEEPKSHHVTNHQGLPFGFRRWPSGRDWGLAETKAWDLRLPLITRIARTRYNFSAFNRQRLTFRCWSTSKMSLYQVYLGALSEIRSDSRLL